MGLSLFAFLSSSSLWPAQDTSAVPIVQIYLCSRSCEHFYWLLLEKLTWYPSLDSLWKWEYFPSIIVIKYWLRIYGEHKFSVSFPSEHAAIRVGGNAIIWAMVFWQHPQAGTQQSVPPVAQLHCWLISHINCEPCFKASFITRKKGSVPVTAAENCSVSLGAAWL